MTRETERLAEAAGYLKIAEEGLCGFAAPSPEGTPLLRPAEAFAAAGSPDARVCKDRPKVRAVCVNKRFCKEYRIRGWWKLLRYRFREPRPYRALAAALRMREAGIPTAEVLLALRGSAHDGLRRDWLVTEELPESLFADRILRKGGVDEAARFIAEAAPAVVAMHHAGIEHGDLNLRNLYRAAEGLWGVIDLDGANFFGHPLSVKRRARETARIATSIWMSFSPDLRRAAPPAEILEIVASGYEKCAGIALPRRSLTDFARRFLAHYEELKGAL